MSTRPPEDHAVNKDHRRGDRRKPFDRWQGAATVRESEETRRKKTIRLIDERRNKRRALAIHFKRRRVGPLKTHHIGRYMAAWDDNAMFLQITPQLASMSKNLGMLCALIMLACCRYQAAALRGTRREIAEWLGVHRDTVTNITRKLVKRGLLHIEARFIDAKTIGKDGRTLYHPQVGNWYSPGPVLRAMWQVISASTAPISYPQGPTGVGEILQSISLNNRVDPGIEPYRRRIKFLRSNTPPTADKVSAQRTVIKKPAAPAENTANRPTKLAGPSTGAPYQPFRSSKTGPDSRQTAPHGEESPQKDPLHATFADALLEAYTRDPELARILALATVRASDLERRRGTG